jgi:proteic killer suppression protein
VKYEILDGDLRSMDEDGSYVCRRFSQAIHKAFRKLMNLIASAVDERDLRTFKSLRLEKLRGDRDGQSSVRLNDQFRLILRFKHDGQDQHVVVIEIVDYH